jgi:hypothetical protein
VGPDRFAATASSASQSVSKAYEEIDPDPRFVFCTLERPRYDLHALRRRPRQRADGHLKKISGASRRGSLTFCNNFATCHSVQRPENINNLYPSLRLDSAAAQTRTVSGGALWHACRAIFCAALERQCEKRSRLSGRYIHRELIRDRAPFPEPHRAVVTIDQGQQPR